MTVRTDAAEEKFDPPHLLYFLFIRLAFGIEIGCVAIENINVLFLDVHVAEQIVPHE